MHKSISMPMRLLTRQSWSFIRADSRNNESLIYKIFCTGSQYFLSFRLYRVLSKHREGFRRVHFYFDGSGPQNSLVGLLAQRKLGLT